MAVATAILHMPTARLMATDIVGVSWRPIIRAIGTPVTPIVGLIMDTAAIRIVDPNGLSRCSRNDIKKTAFGQSLLF